VNVPAAPTGVYDSGSLLAVADNGRNTNSLGNIILKAAGAVNWRGSQAQMNEQLWSETDARGQGSEAAQLQRGWERNSLLSLYFGPSPASLVDPHASFESLKNRWIVAPVTDSLIYGSDRVKPELARWIEDVAKWDFKMISPSHFAARPGTPDDLRAAFAPTLAASSDSSASGNGVKTPSSATTSRNTDTKPYDADDFRLLKDISGVLQFLNVI